jgi:hypothetical protein
MPPELEVTMPLTHLGCPSCGGTLSLAEGQRIVSCRYCSAESLVLIPGSIPRYVVALRVPGETARGIAQQFLRRPALPQAVRERGRIQDVSLCYVPFYEFTGTRLGTFFLRETAKPRVPVTETEGDGQEFHRWLMQPPTVKEDTRVIQQEFVRIRPACELPELGVGNIRLQELRHGPSPVPLEPYDLVALQSRAVVFTPTKAPERFAEDSQRRIKVHGDRTAVVEQRLKILHYPVWQARYRHAGRPYEITVDGVTGSILAARSPVKIRRAAAVAVAALAVAALCFGRPARLLLRAGLDPGGTSGLVVGTLGTLLGLIVGGAVAVFLAWVGWTTFRCGGEMRLDGAKVEPVPGASVMPGGIEGIGARMRRWLLDRWPGATGQG